MAVYRRTYAAYSGRLTPEWSRFLVLFRYSRRSLFKSRFQTGLFVACFFWPLICLAMIYLANNVAFLQRLGGVGQFIVIDNVFFFRFMTVQGVLAFLMTAFAGPGLISPDLANGALPLYFCRPFSRSEYALGKASVLAILLSEITWLPGLILFAVQGSLAGPALDVGSLVDCRQPGHFFRDLDRGPLAAGDGPLRVGEVENRCRSPVVSPAVLRRRVRTGDQCRYADGCRPFRKCGLSDDYAVERAVSG